MKRANKKYSNIINIVLFLFGLLFPASVAWAQVIIKDGRNCNLAPKIAVAANKLHNVFERSSFCERNDSVKYYADFWKSFLIKKQSIVSYRLQWEHSALEAIIAKHGRRIKEFSCNDASWLYEAQSKEEFYRWIIKFRNKYDQFKYYPAFKYFFGKIYQSRRYFEELKRRIKLFRRFPNTQSCKRWIYGLITQLNANNIKLLHLMKVSRVLDPMFTHRYFESGTKYGIIKLFVKIF